MKKEPDNTCGRRVAAAICAVIVLAGETAGITMLHASSDNKSAAEVNTAETEKKSSSDDSDMISAGGTISSSQISDELGIKNTSARLTVEEVLVETGDSVTAGTPIYKVTDDSLAKAEKTLRSELNAAENALREQKSTYQIEMNKAQALYDSELLLGSTAQTDYDSSVKALDSDLQTAYDDYSEALDTVSNTPAEINEKQSELDEKQAAADELSEEKDSLQEKTNAAKKEYSSAAESIESLLPDYNAAAGAVRYLGNMLGKNVSPVSLKQSVTADIKEQTSADSMAGAGRGGSDSAKPDDMDIQGDMPQGDFDMSSLPDGADMDFGGDFSSNFSAAAEKGAEIAVGEAQRSVDMSIFSDKPQKTSGTTGSQPTADTSKKTKTSSAEKTADTAANISKKQEELKKLQAETETVKKEKETEQKKLEESNKSYTAAVKEYNELVTEYNAAAGTVRYLGKSLGKDVSGISLKQAYTGSSQEQQNGSADGKQQDNSSGSSEKEKPQGNFPSDGQKPEFGGEMPDMSNFNKDTPAPDASLSEMKLNSPADDLPDDNAKPAEEQAEDHPEKEPAESEKDKPETEEKEQQPDALTALYDTALSEYNNLKNQLSEKETKLKNAESEYKKQSEALTKYDTQLEQLQSKITVLETEISVLSSSLSDIEGGYETALAEYKSLKEKLDKAEEQFKSAEKEYNELNSSLTECSTELKDAQSEISTLSKEINTLNNMLSKAKTNLTKLKSQYDSLYSSYQKDKLEIQHTLDSDNASYENAEYHYEITCSTLESDLEKAQEAYDTAGENMRIFEEQLSGGYICASRDGIVYSLGFREGRNTDLSSAFAYYVDESDYFTTVELDQYDVTQITIGDKVLIYSSETGISNGRITAVSAGESTSLANVNFNVEIAADEGSDLYNGESVNVYFNYDNTKSGELKDFSGGSGKSGSEGGRPDFGGEMPEGFDFPNMPDFDRRKEE